MLSGDITRDDALSQRLDEARPLAVSSGGDGLKPVAHRSALDDPWRARLVDALNRKHGLRRKTWPASHGQPRRCEPSERWLFQRGK